jgi:prepilin-type N-terminal cleavage/methylation domain-containing protein/prepilin-type processing-associated H-X9-DG protein
MKRKKGFTLIELLVVISIIALLMAILMPSLQRARNMAKNVVCRSNLRSCGLLFIMFAEDNGGKLMESGNSIKEMSWQTQLYPYYGEAADVMVCPNTSENRPAPHNSKPFWRYQEVKGAGNSDVTGYDLVRVGDEYYSYGMNNWILNPKNEKDGLMGNDFNSYWRGFSTLDNADQIPVFGDHHGANGGWPKYNDMPPRYDGEPGSGNTKDLMRRWTINRHDGNINMVFVDGSARTVGLKENWTLLWHRGFNTKGPWTLAGAGDAAAARWNRYAPWMKSFKVY